MWGRWKNGRIRLKWKTRTHISFPPAEVRLTDCTNMWFKMTFFFCWVFPPTSQGPFLFWSCLSLYNPQPYPVRWKHARASLSVVIQIWKQHLSIIKRFLSLLSWKFADDAAGTWICPISPRLCLKQHRSVCLFLTDSVSSVLHTLVLLTYLWFTLWTSALRNWFRCNATGVKNASCSFFFIFIYIHRPTVDHKKKVIFK